MSILLSIDPGLLNPAAAVFVDGILKKASRVKVPKGINTKTPAGVRCRSIALALAEYCGTTPDELIIEWPRIYTAGKSKGDPNGLLPLVGIGMALSGIYYNAKLLSPTPSEWTGQLPKSTTGDPTLSVRGQRIWDRLSSEERSSIIISHDSLDAVGLGLFALGRFERRRVFDAE